MEDDGDDSWEDESSSSTSADDDLDLIDGQTLDHNLQSKSKKYNYSHSNMKKLLKVSDRVIRTGQGQ